MTEDPKTCSRRTLAAGELAIVERCACGTVHVTIGGVTLRVAETAIAPIAAVLGDAARVLVLERMPRADDARIRVIS